MRKIYVLAIVTLFIVSALTPVVAIKDYDKKEQNIYLEYSFSKPSIEKIDKNGQIVDRIKVNGLSNTNEINKISIPVKPLRILIPNGEEIEEIDIYSESKKLAGAVQKPEKGDSLVHISNVYKKIDKNQNEISYRRNSDINYDIFGEYNYRGFRILHINLYPVEVDTRSNNLYYFDNIKLDIKTKNCEGNTQYINPKNIELVEKIVENPCSVNSYQKLFHESIEKFEYLIITSEEFKDYSSDYDFNDLIQSKIDKGISAKIVTVEEIVINPDYFVNGIWGDNNPDNPFYESEIIDNIELFDDTPARIRNFIRHYYSIYDTRYVLLAGDADVANPDENILPLRGLFANESGLPLNNLPEEEQDDIPSDVYYACLDGNFNYDCDDHFGESFLRNDLSDVDEADLYSEVWVGRACVDSVEEVTNFVKKTLYYDQCAGPYLEDVLFVGENLGFPGVSQWGGNYKDTITDYVPDYYNLIKIYDRDDPSGGWYPLDLLDYINSDTPQIINHDGHGNHNYILKMDGSYFTDEYLFNEKPFFIYSHSCLTGSFDNYNCWSGYMENDCIAEILTCENPFGAFACILNARYGLGSEDSLESPSGFFDGSFYKALFTENIKELGAASHFSKEDNVFRIDENGVRWCYYQTNLFGDPELSIKDPNNAPSAPTINGPPSGQFGNKYYYEISSIDPDGDDVYFWIEWYENCPGVSWEGPYDSGEVVTFDNSWDDRGRFTITVKAKDEKGAFSESSTYVVNMPKVKTLKSDNFLDFLQNYPIFYHFLKNLINF